MEKEMGVKGSEEVKVIMITALGDPRTVVKAFYKGGATSYLVKPVDKGKLLEEVRNLGLLQ
jgi:two-component system, chemotaxis family, chemotaxis protein CheY